VLIVEPADRNCLRATVRFAHLRSLPAIIARVRRVFDLAADPVTIGAHLSQDPVLAPLVAARPGLRVPGAWDGFELAVRAILGQQITVSAATSLAGKLVRAYGEKLADPAAADVGLTHVFPTPKQLAGTDQRIGEWTAQYIAMRELREPDAFPAADIGLMRAMRDASGVRPSPAALLAHAEGWRPWRAYAALHLWASEAHASPVVERVLHDQQAA
jgi:AraC family transcriptional regulator of adaptative response / DNA-3-methyladenine glycosylase II